MAIPPGVDASLVKYFKLTWVALASELDSVDPDDEPDKNTLTGTVALRPTLTQPLLFKNIDVPFTLNVMRRQINLASGQLDEQGRAYIKLEASVPEASPIDWYWTANFSVAFKGVPISINPITFMAPPDAEIDLTEMLIAGSNTEYPDITQPSLNTFIQNFGGVRGIRKLNQATYDAIPKNPETFYVIVN